MNLAFAKIPIGVHTVWACIAYSLVLFLLSFLLRLGVSTIIPFEVIIVAILGLIIGDILYGMIKFIPVKDERTGQTKRWAIGTFFSSISDEQRMSNSHIFATLRHSIQEHGFTCRHHIDSISKRELPLSVAFTQRTYLIQSTKHKCFLSSYI